MMSDKQLVPGVALGWYKTKKPKLSNNPKLTSTLTHQRKSDCKCYSGVLMRLSKFIGDTYFASLSIWSGVWYLKFYTLVLSMFNFSTPMWWLKLSCTPFAPGYFKQRWLISEWWCGQQVDSFPGPWRPGLDDRDLYSGWWCFSPFGWSARFPVVSCTVPAYPMGQPCHPGACMWTILSAKRMYFAFQELSSQQRAFQILYRESSQAKGRLTQELQQTKNARNILQAELDKVGAPHFIPSPCPWTR